MRGGDGMLIRGDARSIPLSDGVVQCCVTSPPYWGLRDYGLGNTGIGIEPTPEEYVASIVAAFREVWRVMRDDGTLWLNLGDSHWNRNGEAGSKRRKNAPANASKLPPHAVLKIKDLIGIPWRVAFALQADRWYLRSDIIWHKTNPMQESVRDRPTKAHDYLFLLTKQARYYYDAKAIKESTANSNTHSKGTKKSPPKSLEHADATARVKNNASFMKATWEPVTSRNRRDVWTITKQPYRGAHFATFPEKLVEPCILAGTRPGEMVLDPFCGSGTVGAVARRYGRQFVVMDLSAPYLKLATERISKAHPKEETE